MLKSQQRRIVARKLARELTPAELDSVAAAGGGVTYGPDGSVKDTNYS